MKLNENTKITLTLEQLKKLAKETKRLNEGAGSGYTLSLNNIYLKNATATHDAKGNWTVKGDCTFDGSAEGYEWETDEQEYTGAFEIRLNEQVVKDYVDEYLHEFKSEDFDELTLGDLLGDKDAWRVDDLEKEYGGGWSHVKWDGTYKVENGLFDLTVPGPAATIHDVAIELGERLFAPGQDNCSFSITCPEFGADVEAAWQDWHEPEEF